MNKPPEPEQISVILPSLNEAPRLALLLPAIKATLPGAEILVIDDGSTDNTDCVCRDMGVIRISHPCRMGNGAAIKTGARAATRDYLIFMDADGQHNPADIPALLEKLGQGYPMVVGARSPDTQASFARRIANRSFNRLAGYMAGHRIEDLTCGFRAARADFFRRFLYLLPNGFSAPTTSTMAFFRSGLAVGYVPIRALARTGKSHIRMFQDGLRFLIIILKIGTLFSPMRFFLPLSLVLFLSASAYYAYTYAAFHRFTNMSALVYSASLMTFLFGIVAELVSSLHYRESERQ